MTEATDWLSDRTLGRPTMMEAIRRADPSLPIDPVWPSLEVFVTFQSVMTLVAIMNGLESESLDGPSIKQAIVDYRGSSPLQFGPFNWGNVATVVGTRSVASLCSGYQAVVRFIDGQWTVIADGANGKLLGPQGIVDADPNLLPPLEA